MKTAVSHIHASHTPSLIYHSSPFSLIIAPPPSLPSSLQSLHPSSPLCLPTPPQQNPSSSSQERWHTLRINLEMRCDPKAGTEKRKVETTHVCLITHARTHPNVSTYGRHMKCCTTCKANKHAWVDFSIALQWHEGGGGDML